MNLRNLFFCFLLVMQVTAFAQPAGHSVKIVSPAKGLELHIGEGEDSHITYSLRADGRLLIDQSTLGLDTIAKTAWKKVVTRSVNTTWKPVWGKRELVPDVYNEVTIDLDAYKIIARAYNNGIAFRYEGASTEKELTQFNFAGNYTAWYYNGEYPNIGPETLTEAKGIRKPVMTAKAGENSYIAVHEAALESGDPLLLQPQEGTTLFSVPSRRAKAWRVIMFGRTPGELVDSHLLELLNPGPEADFSWVKPGLAVWDWRINGAKTNGFNYEMSLPSWKRMVDFAAANKIPSLVLDADWYGPEFKKESDPLKGGKVEQVRQLVAYAKEKAVGIWLYLNDVGGVAYPLEQTIQQYGSWGAVGLKYGFMKGGSAEKNRRTQLITQLCAQNHLLVNFHDGPVHPYGQMRTWPNAVTREYCHSQLDAHRVFEPKTFVTAVFVNMLAGPLDMDNGMVDMVQEGRVDNPMPVPSTITAEAARTLITFSGATILPDIPENYNRHPQILEFISAQKMPWQESKTLGGEIGEYIVMARKAADGNWLIAAATNESARTVRIPLSIMEKGAYKALIIRDGKDAGFRTRKESYTTTTTYVTNNQTIDVWLAPGGGACILLRKK
jgi:alpha-glucosidase